MSTVQQAISDMFHILFGYNKWHVLMLMLMLMFVPTRLYDTIAYENIQFLFIDIYRLSTTPPPRSAPLKVTIVITNTIVIKSSTRLLDEEEDLAEMKPSLRDLGLWYNKKQCGVRRMRTIEVKQCTFIVGATSVDPFLSEYCLPFFVWGRKSLKKKCL